MRIRTRILAAAAALLPAVAMADPPPSRIVSINLCADELLVSLADPGQIAGLSIYATDPGMSFTADKAKAFRHDAASAESVVGLHPDLILAGRYTKLATRDMLSRLGYHVELLDTARSVEESVALIRRVATLVGHPERGEALVAKIEAAKQRAEAAAAMDAVHPSAAVYQRRGYVTGGDTLTGELLSIAGFTNDGGALAGKYGAFVPLEKLVANPPDYIVVASARLEGRGSGERPPRASGGSSTLPAGQTHRAAAEPDGVRRPVVAGSTRLDDPRGGARSPEVVISADHIWLLALALALDAVFGDPAFVWRRVPHPIVVIGAFIGLLDRVLNQPRFPAAIRRALGVIATLLIAALGWLVGWVLETLFQFPFGWIGTAIVASVFLAGRSLYDHVRAVAEALQHGTDAARAAVAEIVGRDPASLDEAAIARAAIELTAENLSDAVVAPALWFLLFGLPGLIAYKAINTANSMIGHRTERHRAFGWAAARLDDLVNLPASRFSGLLLVFAAQAVGAKRLPVMKAMLRDASTHRSPNAGWPEAAMAAALGVALAGPRRYGGTLVDDAWMNQAGRRDANATDIRRALRLYLATNIVILSVAAAGGLSVLWS